MEIIFGDYMVARDHQGWVVKKRHIIQKGKNKGDILWREPKYYPNLELTLKRTLDRMLREEEVKHVDDVKAVISQIQEAKEELKGIIDNLGESLKVK